MSNVAAGKDIDDEGETLNDVEAALNRQGIALRSSQHEWRNFEDVLEEVAEKWKSWNDDQQGQVATAIAGVRQQENFRALMNNWDEVGRLAGVAANSTGSATKRMEIYLDSIEAKTNKLKASWENFVMSLNQNESWGELLDMLSNFLDKLTYVDWDKVLKVLIAFGSLAALTKVVQAISGAIAAAKVATTIGAGIAGTVGAISGILPAVLAILGVVTAIGVAWKSVGDNAESTLEDIENRKKALEKEEDTVRELYKRYAELEGKEKYYKLTQEEKQELVDITKTLVEQYGFETTGVDALTGSYKLANNALESYLDNLEREKRILSSDEEKTLKKEAKNDIKDIKKAKDKKSELEDKYGKAFLTGTDEEQKEILKLLAQIGVGEGKKSRGAGGLSREGQKMIDDASKILREKYGYTTNDFNSLIDNNKLNLASTLSKGSGIKNYLMPSEWTDDDYNAILNYFHKSAVVDYYKQDTTISAKSKEIAESIKRLINNEIGEDVSTSVSDIITNSLSTALSQEGMVDSIGDVDEFIENYTNNFIQKINANGEDVGVVVNKYKTLQQKLDDGTLLSEEYDDYQTALQTYLALQREALEATGLGKEKIDELMIALENDAIDNFNIKLLEINENIQNGQFSEDAKRNFNEFSKYLSNLNGAFKLGEISTNDYFDTLNKKINSIDLSKLEDTFGSVENFSATLGTLASDTSNYIDSIITIFQGGGDSLEFYNNLAPAINGLSNITKTLNDLDEKNESVDISKELKGETHKETRAQNTAKKIKDIIDVQGVWTEEQTEERTKEVQALIEELENLKATGKDVEEIEIVDEEGLNQAQESLDNIMNTFEEWDINSLDKAYETITSAFDGLEGDITSLVGTANNEVKNSAKEISDWLINTAKANNEYSQGAIQAIESMVDESGNKIKYSTDLSSEQLNNLLLTSQSNLNSAQTAMNQAASTQMGKAVQALGTVLSEMGEAMNKLEIKIPIKIPNYKLDLVGFALGTGIFKQVEGLESELVIGGNGTTNSIGSALKSIGDRLQTKEFADTIGNAFSPIQSNYIPNTNPNGQEGNKVAPPSDKGSGSKYTAEDAASDLKDILQDIEGYEADIELDLEDQTEQLLNHYNLERNKLDTLKEELDYYEGIYDSTENTTKWLETQNKILENQSKRIAEMQIANAKIEAQREKIYRDNAGYNVAGWFDSEGNTTLAYGDLINSFAYRKNAIEKETAAAMRAVYNSVAGSTNKDTIQAAKDKIKQIEEEGDIKIKALEQEQEKVENIYNSVEQLNEAWDENKENIRDALAELHEKVIELRDTLTDQLMEQLEKAVERQNETIEKDVTRIEQLVTIQERYNSILNETLDTQAELDSELQSSLDSFEYLDEQMRQLMFNEEDYEKLSSVLSGIQEEIAIIWEDHYKQINSLTDEEMYKAEFITSETERQLEMKMKEYELAKAELDIAKARTNLQNVQSERNVRMFIGGQWQWVADPNAVKDAQQQLADAERAKDKIERESEQQLLINKMNKIIDADNLGIAENNELLENVQEAIEAQTVEVQSIEQALSNIQSEKLPALNTVLQGAFGENGEQGSIAKLFENLNKSTIQLTMALSGKTINQAVDSLKSNKLSKSEFNTLIERLGYSFNETTGIVTTPDGSFSAHYAGWNQQSTADVQLNTAPNGVQVTGGGESSNISTGGGGNPSGFPRTGHVSTSSLPLRLRSGAGTNYKILGLMPKGAALEVLSAPSNGWAKVRYNGVTGYASTQYLTYDQGGIIRGKGVFLKDVNVPERVLSPRQTKAFENLVTNLTTNPVLSALSRNPQFNSKFNDVLGNTSNNKYYQFSNFEVKANNLTEFINSLEGMIPIADK